ncbi:hypothetical protein AUJ65_01975 [Candidatus Micrarchaeota archaeon CG1_02_51_15]|nr:MAG: hypothetical protein AUJ65_01975 [Candidatus Micrarchaeota archaeon CG1_02_51_15]
MNTSVTVQKQTVSALAHASFALTARQAFATRQLKNALIEVQATATVNRPNAETLAEIGINGRPSGLLFHNGAVFTETQNPTSRLKLTYKGAIHLLSKNLKTQDLINHIESNFE